MLLHMLNDFEYWGTICTLIIGFGWLVSFSMLVVCVRHTKLPKDIAQCVEMQRILPSECIKDE